jgi:hypothetical protein
VGRGLAAVLVLAILTLAGCTEEGNPSADRQEQKKTASERARKQASPSTAPTSGTGRVGDTAEVGPFLVTLNDAETRLSAEGDKDHHYAVADLTLENRTREGSLDTSKTEYLLRDEEGYSFTKGSLPEQKPQPEGQVTPGGKASGEVAFDLGTDPVKGPLTLSISLEKRPDAPPAVFEFEVQPAEDKPKPKPTVAENDESEPQGASAKRPRSTGSDYQIISDPSGSLTVEVPVDWEAETGEASEGRGGPNSWSYYAGEYITASITTARSLDAWYQGGTSSGVYLVASRALARDYTDYQLTHSLLNVRKNEKCTAGPYADMDRSSYSGKIQTWYGCGAGGATTLSIAAAPAGRECVVVLGAKIREEPDREAVEHLIDTFEVDCGALPPPAPAVTEASATPSASASASASLESSASASAEPDSSSASAAPVPGSPECPNTRVTPDGVQCSNLPDVISGSPGSNPDSPNPNTSSSAPPAPNGGSTCPPGAIPVPPGDPRDGDDGCAGE